MSEWYELVGHSFTSLGDGMSLQHHFAFSISLPLTTGSRWIAYYHWLEGSQSNRPPESLSIRGKETKIASGLGLAPIKFPSDEGYPKDIIKGEPTTKLNYTRFTTGDVLIRLDVGGQKPRVVLDFRMAEPQTSPKHEEFSWNGFVVSWPANSEKGGRKQVLGKNAWWNATHDYWRPAR